jgi:hypothetical protein
MGKDMPFHQEFLLNKSLPALAEHYGDVFVALQVLVGNGGW